MNRPIARLFVLVLVMFGALVAYTSRWSVFDASALQDNKLNARTLLETQNIQRGTIYAADSSVIADAVRGSEGIYVRRYPFGSLFAVPVGYSFPDEGSVGLEAYDGSLLAGTPLDHESIVDQLEGHQSGGDSVYTTLDPSAQQVALQALEARGHTGAVVAITPSSGAIRVFATNPTFNPSLIPRASYRRSLLTDSRGPEFDRVTQAQDYPGSIQKVVTAVAAIDSGKFTPETLVNGNSPQTFEGIPLHNDGDMSYGNITLTDALTQSVNTVYANVAQDLGPTILAKYMSRLGYYRDPPIDLPSDELAPSGVRDNKGNLVPVADSDVPLVGIGEGELDVTPLQMVMVAAAVANGGKLMRPYLTQKVVNADGVTVQRTTPSLFSTVMKPSTATAVTTMMEGVVQDGTAEHALAGFNITPIAGKTGTAELGNSTNSPNDAWFIAFAPGKDIAVAVVVEKTYDYGASAAAPIARDVLESLVGASG
ncbi:MAG TPA: penicillin-binding transpeptidase domain-containing protein [Solirubrobacteraceae bacterium]|nr:penicillin-binding transpeptidase domain-containing protein [Solirubrobacteraceae bacterium]